MGWILVVFYFHDHSRVGKLSNLKRLEAKFYIWQLVSNTAISRRCDESAKDTTSYGSQSKRAKIAIY